MLSNKVIQTMSESVRIIWESSDMTTHWSSLVPKLLDTNQARKSEDGRRSLQFGITHQVHSRAV